MTTQIKGTISLDAINNRVEEMSAEVYNNIKALEPFQDEDTDIESIIENNLFNIVFNIRNYELKDQIFEEFLESVTKECGDLCVNIIAHKFVYPDTPIHSLSDIQITQYKYYMFDKHIRIRTDKELTVK